MKCLSCDEILTDREATRKSVSGYFIELCDPCYEYIKDEMKMIDSMESDKLEEN